MPQANNDDWEDLTPGASAATAVADKPSDDEWEDVYNPQAIKTSAGAPDKPGFFSTVKTDIGNMVAPLYGGHGVQLEDSQAFKKKFDAMSPTDKATQVAKTKAGIAGMPHSDIASTESQNYQGRVASGQSVPRAAAETAYELGGGANMTGFDTAVKSGNAGEALGHLAAPPVLAGATHGAAKVIEHAPMIANGVASVASAIPEATQAGKDWIGTKMRVEPTPGTVGKLKSVSTLKPGVKALANVGKLVGGPELINWLSPDHPDLPDKITADAQEAANTKNAQFDKAAQIKQDKLTKASQKAAQDLEDTRNQHAEDLLNRQVQQDKLDAAKAKADNTLMRSQRTAQTQQGADMAKEIEYNKKQSKLATDAADENRQRDAKAATDSAKQLQQAHDDHAKTLQDLEAHRQKTLADREKLNNQWGSALNSRGESGAEVGAPTVNTAPESAVGSPSSQDLITRTRKIRIAGERPSAADLKQAGDMTQVPDEVLKVLAKNGDMIAKGEYENRRLKGSLGIIRRLN